MRPGTGCGTNGEDNATACATTSSVRVRPTMSPDAALALERALHDAATMLCWGCFAYLAALVPRDLARAVGIRLRAFRVGAIILAAGTTMVALPIEVAGIGDGWSAALDWTTTSAVLFETGVGQAWQAQAILALLLAATLALPARHKTIATAVASGLLLASLALTGHAAMHERGLGVLHRLNDAVHVLAGGAWLGSLLPLLPILGALERPTEQAAAAVALRHFSTAGHVAVAVVMATGSLNTLLVLGRWPTDLASPYQALLGAKIGLVLIMVTLALANRYILVPRMKGRPLSSATALRRATVAEIALGFGVVGLVSLFGLLEPA